MSKLLSQMSWAHLIAVRCTCERSDKGGLWECMREQEKGHYDNQFVSYMLTPPQQLEPGLPQVSYAVMLRYTSIRSHNADLWHNIIALLDNVGTKHSEESTAY